MAQAVDHPDNQALAAGQAALRAGEWQRAAELLRAVLAAREDPAAWEALGWAAWWLADEEATFEARGRAFRLYREASEDAAAGRVAS